MEWVWEFQSPRSGKFVSDTPILNSLGVFIMAKFQSPRSGKFVSDYTSNEIYQLFGSFVSIP